LTVFAAGDERELGLATNPQFRGRGLATLAAAACVAQAARESIHLHWRCWASNPPSAAIAEKLGFQRLPDAALTIIQTGAA
jgi:RimJ/RimL family protein N-acetyltransferase